MNINKTENGKTIEEMSRTKSCFSERSTKTTVHLTIMSKKEDSKFETQDERRDNTTDFTEIKKFKRKYCD